MTPMFLLAVSFFEIVGIACTILFVLLLIVALLIAWKVRSFFKGLGEALKQAGLAATPSTIHLERAASPEARFVVGQTFMIDGGLSAQ